MRNGAKGVSLVTIAAGTIEAQERIHLPVLKDEVMDLLALEPGAVVVDGTAGGGGHLRAIAEAVGPRGRVIAFDRDPRAHQDDAAGGVARRYADRVTLVQRPFSEVERVLAELHIGEIDALLADLGVSSMQIDDDARGFSFLREGPLDMRMDTSRGETVLELLERVDEEELADILYLLGEERASRRIARFVLATRPLPATTTALAELIARALGGRKGRIHPATKSFQALRIATNRELDELDQLLAALPRVLRIGGRAALISFHSLEDRKVKRCFNRGPRTSYDDEPHPWRQLTKKPVVPSDDEIQRNPRARSAKLRVAERRS
jgi:16S rRNA (cytosine1402-N4)-methyltransferase